MMTDAEASKVVVGEKRTGRIPGKLGGGTNPLRGRGVCGAIEVMERALRLD